SFSPGGAAAPDKGGFRLSGRWSFCSGVDNAQWMFLGAIFGPPSGGSPMPDIRYVMAPQREGKIIDDWDVMGLRGTGSKSFALDNAFVPEHRVLAHAAMVEGTTPGAQVHDGWLYSAPIWTFVPFTISAPANGIARGAFEAFIDEMRAREASFDHSPMAKKPGMHLRVAQAGARGGRQDRRRRPPVQALVPRDHGQARGRRESQPRAPRAQPPRPGLLRAAGQARSRDVARRHRRPRPVRAQPHPARLPRPRG